MGSVAVTINPPVDPVAGSVADTALSGIDANSNGVRDDLEAYITQRYSDSVQLAIMMNWASAATEVLLANDLPSILTAQATLNSAAMCARNSFGLAAYQEEKSAVLAALLNNAIRFQAYYNNQQMLDGLSVPRPSGITCNLDGQHYNGTP